MEFWRAVSSEKAKILVIEDEELQRTELLDLLKEANFHVEGAASGHEALEKLESEYFDIVLIDRRLPDTDGIELLKQIKALDPTIDAIIVTAYGSIDTAVAAIKAGAYDYITKPVDVEELILRINHIVEKRSMEIELRALREELAEKLDIDFVFKSEQMRRVMDMVSHVAPTSSTVLITGESGTGKEMIARIIHQLSGRRGRFVAVACPSIPESLIEAELFGYEKGAFTGAVGSKPGKFELADKGTIFLDEIGDMPMFAQAKILRVLQEREVERLGATKARKVDVRVIAATNQNLEELVREGRFREDLYYRINVIHIHIPPLRERKEDIIPLAEHFLKKISTQLHKQVSGFSREAVELLLSYDWPGNVRELENAVERAVVLAKTNLILPQDLPISLKSERRASLKLEDVEKEHIALVLNLTDWNISRAAEILGIHRNTLREKIKRYGLRQP